MKPAWLKRNIACPDCGFRYINEPHLAEHTSVTNKKEYDGYGFIPCAVDCPNCKSHWTWEEFWNEQNEKWAVGGYSSRAMGDIV